MAETKNLGFKVPATYESKSPLKDDTSFSQDTQTDTGDCNKTDKNSQLNVPLPYEEPEWSGSPTLSHSFEVIKNGTVVDTLNIKTPFIVFGRLNICDVVFEHPSVSRYHAIVQYCKGDDSHPKGFYLYDLGSTHGTFLNKEKIKSKIYYKLKVGYVVKFGGSSRLHIFQGPEEEEQEEKKSPVLNKPADEICDWGLGEDAEEEEDLSENPFALSTPNEELYLDDPKKTLRGWFEREGYELEYDVEEKGFKTFVCRVQLPIDTPTGDFMPIETSVSGKKKEAVIACALEACRTLDRLGLLRQSHQESRQRKKKKWEENDYYDSDEDTFLDRTGTIEKKRERRKRIDKKSEVETFQSLEMKLKLVVEEIDEIKNKLSTSTITVQSKNTEVDSLEEYMTHLSESSKTTSDKIERTKLKFRLTEAEKERLHLEKLLDIARPAKLPPVTKYPGMIGKKLKSKFQPPISKPIPEKLDLNLDENEEEIESDSETNAIEGKIDSVKSQNRLDVSESEPVTLPKNYGLIMKDELEVNRRGDIEMISEFTMENTSSDVCVPSTKKSTEPVVNKSETDTGDKNITVHFAKRPILPARCNSNTEAADKNILDPSTKLTAGPIMNELNAETVDKNVSAPKRKKKNNSEVESTIDVYETKHSEYSTWVPPVGQSGDGMTHLNAKYGY